MYPVLLSFFQIFLKCNLFFPGFWCWSSGVGVEVTICACCEACSGESSSSECCSSLMFDCSRIEGSLWGAERTFVKLLLSSSAVSKNCSCSQYTARFFLAAFPVEPLSSFFPLVVIPHMFPASLALTSCNRKYNFYTNQHFNRACKRIFIFSSSITDIDLQHYLYVLIISKFYKSVLGFWPQGNHTDHCHLVTGFHTLQ